MEQAWIRINGKWEAVIEPSSYFCGEPSSKEAHEWRRQGFIWSTYQQALCERQNELNAENRKRNHDIAVFFTILLSPLIFVLMLFTTGR